MKTQVFGLNPTFWNISCFAFFFFAKLNVASGDTIYYRVTQKKSCHVLFKIYIFFLSSKSIFVSSRDPGGRPLGIPLNQGIKTSVSNSKLCDRLKTLTQTHISVSNSKLCDRLKTLTQTQIMSQT